MNSYNNFPTLRLVSFKKPRYHSNRMQCCGINKGENAMLINAKRSTSKTKSKKNQNKTIQNKNNNNNNNKNYLQGRNVFWEKFLRLTRFTISIPSKNSCAPPSELCFNILLFSWWFSIKCKQTTNLYGTVLFSGK